MSGLGDLREALERTTQEAARYRWLRDRLARQWSTVCKILMLPTPFNVMDEEREQLDQEIDKARNHRG